MSVVPALVWWIGSRRDQPGAIDSQGWAVAWRVS
jgi:hypothetical protein